jgi:hypothetical protein
MSAVTVSGPELTNLAAYFQTLPQKPDMWPCPAACAVCALGRQISFASSASFRYRERATVSGVKRKC